MEQRIVFEDKNVSYKTFLEDLATFLAPKIALLIKNPPKKYYSERESMRVFGSGNVRRWIKEGKLKPFSKRKGKTEYKVSDLQELHRREQDYFLKQRAMYRIKRYYQVAEKQPWLIDLLVKLKPSYFAPCQGIEECKLALHNLGEDIKQQELSWKRGKFLLSYIRDITEKDDEIIISYKGGKPCVSFKIEESKA